MSNILLKLECLKLAYDTFHKTGGFSTARVYKMEDSSENLIEDVKEVFALSDMNFTYILQKSSETTDE